MGTFSIINLVHKSPEGLDNLSGNLTSMEVRTMKKAKALLKAGREQKARTSSSERSIRSWSQRYSQVMKSAEGNREKQVTLFVSLVGIVDTATEAGLSKKQVSGILGLPKSTLGYYLRIGRDDTLMVASDTGGKPEKHTAQELFKRFGRVYGTSTNKAKKDKHGFDLVESLQKSGERFLEKFRSALLAVKISSGLDEMAGYLIDPIKLNKAITDARANRKTLIKKSAEKTQEVAVSQ